MGISISHMRNQSPGNHPGEQISSLHCVSINNFLIKRALPDALRKKPSHQEGSPGGPSCIVFGFLPRRPSEEHAVGQLDIQSQPYEGLNSKCLARIYANKQYTTSGGSGSRKRTHTNTKASKNYATKPPDEEPLTNILGSSGPTLPLRPQGRKCGPPCAGGRPFGGGQLLGAQQTETWNIFIASDSPAIKVPGARAHGRPGRPAFSKKGRQRLLLDGPVLQEDGSVRSRYFCGTVRRRGRSEMRTFAES